MIGLKTEDRQGEHSLGRTAEAAHESRQGVEDPEDWIEAGTQQITEDEQS